MKTKQKFPRLLTLALAGLSLTVLSSSCKDDEPMPTPVPNIVQLAQSDTSLSILVSAVEKADLGGALSNNSSNLTVFAPTNNAFRALGYTSASIGTLDVAGVAALKKVLLHHVLGEKIPASAITQVNIAKVTLNADSIYASGNSAGVFINGVKVEKANLAASNGIVHVIGKVLLPPVGNLRETAISTPGFTLLVAAVLRADSTTNAISNALTGPGPLTVFAPTDAAFRAAGFADAAAITAAPPYILRNILLYHVVGARVFSGDLPLGAVKTVQGTNVTIAAGNPPTVKGTNSEAAKIIVTDVAAKNGVIHAIDKVLLP